VILNGMTGVTHAARLKIGRVIVAINGIRVHNSKKYFYFSQIFINRSENS